MKLLLPTSGRARAGFTLAELAVTLVIVGMTLLIVLEGVNNSRSTATQTKNRKIAQELALLTIARVESGLFWEELDGLGTSLSGTYAEEDYPAFSWEMIIGDEEFAGDYDDDQDPYFDNLRHRRDVAEEYDEADDDEEAFSDTGSSGGPFERVSVRVSYPQLTDKPSTLTIERWIPLEQVFGNEDGEMPTTGADG